MTTIIAQIAADWWAPLTQLGFAGAMLYWFTQRAEARMKAMEDSIKSMPDSIRSMTDSIRDTLSSLEESVDLMAKAALLQILSFEQRESTIKAQAKAMLDEIDKKRNS